ncbi:MAG: phosphoribosylamine--glycine ligase [Rikenellaceae bacterium]
MELPAIVNVLLLGSGGRESAFAWKIAQSPRLGKLFIATGNGGTAASGINVDISPNDFPMIGQFVQTNHINLVVVGSEEPLVRGIKDFFIEDENIRHTPIVGPSKAAAAMEGSKEFSKEFMERHNIPTAKYKSVTKDNLDEGCDFLASLSAPYVLKADGLAAGKGVLIIDTLAEAQSELRSMILDQRFGAASSKVVIEEFLDGIEVSVFVATDGKSYKILPEAKDYKRIGEGHTGPNTGGMGAISPVPFYDEVFAEKVRSRIIEPTVDGIAKDELDYRGFIFFGLISCKGEPMVIEYNVRMGDPETEAVLPRITSDIIDLFDGIVHQTLDTKTVEISPLTAATVVVTSQGYPNDYPKGLPISGLDNQLEENVTVFHAGTTQQAGEMLTSGGRVLAITALDNSIETATAKAYRTIEGIHFEGAYRRGDIGQDLLEK